MSIHQPSGTHLLADMSGIEPDLLVDCTRIEQLLRGGRRLAPRILRVAGRCTPGRIGRFLQPARLFRQLLPLLLLAFGIAAQSFELAREFLELLGHLPLARPGAGAR